MTDHNNAESELAEITRTLQQLVAVMAERTHNTEITVYTMGKLPRF